MMICKCRVVGTELLLYSFYVQSCWFRVVRAKPFVRSCLCRGFMCRVVVHMVTSAELCAALLCAELLVENDLSCVVVYAVAVCSMP